MYRIKIEALNDQIIINLFIMTIVYCYESTIDRSNEIIKYRRIWYDMYMYIKFQLNVNGFVK